MNRHLSRMIAMQSLYEWQFRHSDDLEQITQRNIGEYSDKCEAEFTDHLVKGVSVNLSEIEKEISKSSEEWPIDQISLIDKIILQIAIFELLHSQETPAKVIINEAVELSKQFGGENSSRFVNGVLGSVYKMHEKDLLTRI